jgi:hypothetical protein
LPSGASAQLVVDAARLVALRAEDVQAARVDDRVMLGFRGRRMLGDGFIPLLLRGFELL